MSKYEQLIAAISEERKRLAERLRDCGTLAVRVLNEFRQSLGIPPDEKDPFTCYPLNGEDDAGADDPYTVRGALRGGSDGRYHLGVKMVVDMAPGVPEQIIFEFAFEPLDNGTYKVQCGNGPPGTVDPRDSPSIRKYCEDLFESVLCIYQLDGYDGGPIRVPVPPEQQN